MSSSRFVLAIVAPGAMLVALGGCRGSSSAPDAAGAAAATPSAPGIPAVDVALAEHHGCLREASGVVKCWGRSVAGEVGDGTEIPDTPFSNVRTVPTPVVGAVGPGSLHVSDALSWVVHPDHTVTAWGSVAMFTSEGRQVRPWRSLVPKHFDVPPVTALAVGYGALCGISPEGRVLCAGPSEQGSAGDSAPAGGDGAHDVFAPVRSVPHAEAIVMYGYDTCVLDQGKVTCWGGSWGTDLGEIPNRASHGPPLQDEDDRPRPTVTPTRSDGGARPQPPPHGPHPTGHAHRIQRKVVTLPLAGIVRLVAGPRAFCAVDGAGAVSCWAAESNALPTNPEPKPRTLCGGPAETLALGMEACERARDGAVCCEDRYGLFDTSRLRGATHFFAPPVGVCGLVSGELRCAGRGGATEKNLYASP